MKKTGLADSPLFRPHQALPPAPSQERSRKADRTVAPSKAGRFKRRAVNEGGNRGAMQPRNHDAVVSRYHDSLIEEIRKAVKELGKEAATHRFTAPEKMAIADVIHEMKSKGIKTSENEITRIAVNFVVRERKARGRASILDRALKALNE